MPRLKPVPPPPPPPVPVLQTKLAFSVEEAAEIVGLSRATFYRLIKNGMITPLKAGRRTLVARIEIERYLCGTVSPPPELTPESPKPPSEEPPLPKQPKVSYTRKRPPMLVSQEATMPVTNRAVSAPSSRKRVVEVQLPEPDRPTAAELSGQHVLTIEEAAGFLRISRTQAYKLVKTGALRPVAVGTKAIIPRSELQRFLGEPSPSTTPSFPGLDALVEAAVERILLRRLPPEPPPPPPAVAPEPAVPPKTKAVEPPPAPAPARRGRPPAPPVPEPPPTFGSKGLDGVCCQEIAERLAKDQDLDPKVAERMTRAVLSALVSMLRDQAGDRRFWLKVSGLGIFSTVARPGRDRINPRTGQKLHTPAQIRLHFKFAKSLNVLGKPETEWTAPIPPPKPKVKLVKKPPVLG